MKLSTLEREFINTFQGDFPLTERPFKYIAGKLNSTEDEIIQTVKRLQAEKLLTRFGPLYDAARLGGGLTLAAMSVPLERYGIVTEQVNAFTEVAHNYRREHELNMWFVIATETPEQINRILLSIQHATGLKVYNFPKLQEFYIGLWLHLAEDDVVSTIPVPAYSAADRTLQLSVTDNTGLEEIDRKLITGTQSGIPVEATPYKRIANGIGISEKEVLQRMQQMLKHGIIRRIGAVPNHYRLGLTANGMTVWEVVEDRITEMGNAIGQLDFVSHCYHRPRLLPVWPYNLFAMVHGHDRKEVYEKTKQVKSLLGDNCHAHEVLFSSAILKKTGLRLAA